MGNIAQPEKCMSKQFLLIELSREPNCAINGESLLHDVIIEINHPENLTSFGVPCKDRHVINNNLDLCQKITSWLRFFGIGAILDKSEQDKNNPAQIYLCDGGIFYIDGWEILDQKAKDLRIASNVPDSDQDDPITIVYEFTDTLSLSQTKTFSPLDKSVFIATRNSYSGNYDLVLECLFDQGKKYGLYQGLYDADTNIQVILNDLSLLPSIKEQKSLLGETYITCNALELFKDTFDAVDVNSEHVDTFVQLDVTRFETPTIEMDYIELQATIHNNAMFAFMGNDPIN